MKVRNIGHQMVWVRGLYSGSASGCPGRKRVCFEGVGVAFGNFCPMFLAFPHGMDSMGWPFPLMPTDPYRPMRKVLRHVMRSVSTRCKAYLK